MRNDKPEVWFVIGKWRGQKWRAMEAYRSEYQARQSRLRREDIRRVKFQYLD